MVAPERLAALADLDRRLVPVFAGRLRVAVTRLERARDAVGDDVRRQRALLRDARTEQRVRGLRPVLQAGSQRVLGGLALVLLVAAVALLVLGG